jgi:hypothetical protein
MQRQQRDVFRHSLAVTAEREGKIWLKHLVS